jgi:4-cresol dehydrogenase (hydroxylating) flavoprotein subunit
MDLKPHLIEELIRIVGREHFSMEPAVRDHWARTTLPQEGARPVAVVQPATREEVQQIVRMSAANTLPVYPISTGKNWGYGDACAPLPGCLLLDLSRMNRILEVNIELAYAVVEPGVTQGQLFTHLEKTQTPLMMDCTGAGPDTSLIGNTLERGFGHSPYGDRFACSCNYEVVLPDGSLLTTGFGGYPNARAQHLYKWGVGPSLDGLLTQSNLGIVTRMTIWLMPKPESIEYFFVGLKTPEAIGGLVEALRRLRLQGTVRSTVHCFNERRMLAGRMRYPWNEVDGTQALEKQRPELLHRLCRELGVPSWGASGILFGSRHETAAARRNIQKELSDLPGLDRLTFLDEKRFQWANRLAGFLRLLVPNHTLARHLPLVRLAMDLLAGRPSYETLKGGHWRARQDPDLREDPLDSRSGLIWIAPVLPMTKQAVRELTTLVEPIFHEFGFEYQMTLSCTTDRALAGIISISFDKDSLGETARAEQCSKKLLDVLLTQGFVPYRGSPAVMEHVRKQAPVYWEAVAQLKQAWDPQNMIAPGRYIP